MLSRGGDQSTSTSAPPLEGQYYSGYYQREFGSEQEAGELVRDLQGKSVIVSCNPLTPPGSAPGNSPSLVA